MPRAVRTTRVNNPGGTVIINPPPAEPNGAATVETIPEKKNFWEAQEVLNGAEGQKYLIYLYRLNPSGPGYGGMVTKFTKPVTMEEIQEQYGGYEYRISLHLGSKWICSETFKIASPPKMMGIADPNVIAGMPNAGGSGGGTDTAVLQKQLLEFVEKQSKEKGNDPAYMASLRMVEESAKGLIAAAQNSNRNPAAETMQSQMMTMMFSNMSTLNNTLMTRLLAPPENPVNALAQLKDLLGIIPLLTGVKIPGVGGGRTDPWASIAETAIANVPRVLEAAGPLMDKWGAIARERTRAVAIAHGQPVPGDAPAAVGGGPGGAAIHVVPSIPPQQPTQAPAPPAATAFATDAWTDAPQQPAPKPAAPGNSVQVVAPDAQWIKVRLVNLIAKGMSGESLMDWLIGTDENMAVVLQQSSAEQIRAFFSMDPVLSQALSLPNFDQTLSEAIEYLHQGAQPAAAVQ